MNGMIRLCGRLAYVFMALVLYCSTSWSQSFSWVNTGPGPIRALTVHSDDTTILYSGSFYSGIFRSTDSGLSWTFNGQGLPAGLGVYGGASNLIVFHPTDHSKMYVGTGLDESSEGRSLFVRSGSEGSWRAITNGIAPYSTIRSIAFAVREQVTMFAGIIGSNGTRGVYKSTDDGESWTAVWTHTTESGPVMVDPGPHGAVWYVDAEGTVAKSTDLGSSWTSVANGMNVYGARKLIRMSDSGRILFLSLYRGVFVVSDTLTLTARSAGLPVSSESNGRYWDLTEHHSRLFVAAGDSGLYRSEDEGMSWQKVLTHASYSVIGSGATLYAGTQFGLYGSTDQGTTWNFISCDIGTGNVADVDIAPAFPSIVLVAQQNGMFKSTDAGVHWMPLPAAGFGPFNCAAVDRADPSILYAGAGGYFTSFIGFFKSTDGGATWVDRSPIAELPVTALEIRQDSANIIYIGSPGNVWKSTDRGETWELIHVRVGATETQTVKVSPSDHNVLYLGASSNHPERAGVYVTQNAGWDWERRVNGYPQDAVLILSTLSLAIDPLNPATAYAGSSEGGMRKTTSYGTSWTSVGAGYRVADIVIRQSDPSRVFAANSAVLSHIQGSLMLSTDAGSSWTDIFNSSVYNTSASNIALVEVSGQERLYVGTYGGGVFKSGAPLTQVDTSEILVPDYFGILPNYPNPFNPSTMIEFMLPARGPVTLEVVDLMGRVVATLIQGTYDAGSYRTMWNANGMSAGVYLCRLRSGRITATTKMVLMK